jgi:Uma2 family endonuclease
VSTIARLTLAEYDRMIQSGVFDSRERRRLEFIRGEIREMSPIGPPHEEVVDRLARWSFKNLPEDRVRVRVQNSIGLPELESAPEPDIAWVAERTYWRGRPTAADVLLIVEVADSSLSYDRGKKAQLYAEAGLSDYWVVDIPGRVIEVRRDPRDGEFRSLEVYRGEDEIRPLGLPDLVLRPAMLWP